MRCEDASLCLWLESACWSPFLGFPAISDGKESACNSGDLGSIPGLGRSPGEGNGYSHEYSCLENPCGQRSLAGSCPWDHKELDTTEQLTQQYTTNFWRPLFLLYIIAPGCPHGVSSSTHCGYPTLHCSRSLIQAGLVHLALSHPPQLVESKGAELARETKAEDCKLMRFRTGGLFPISFSWPRNVVEVLSGLTEEMEAYLAEEVLCLPFFKQGPPFPARPWWCPRACIREQRWGLLRWWGASWWAFFVFVFTVDPGNFYLIL